VSIVNKGFSAIGKLLTLVGLAAVFLLAMVGVVYMSLQGNEIKVPEIVGKNFGDSEKELALLGLKIKRRADRFSTEAPNTILEQLPKPGETVKTGQMILVVLSKAGGEGEEPPTSLKKTLEEDDSDKIEEMISEKPKKKANTNTNKKKADTTRDVIGDNSNSNSNSNDDSKGKEPGQNNEPVNKTIVITPGNRQTPPAANRQGPAKPPGGEQQRPRSP
jgi:hypothetical protein